MRISSWWPTGCPSTRWSPTTAASAGGAASAGWSPHSNRSCVSTPAPGSAGPASPTPTTTPTSGHRHPRGATVDTRDRRVLRGLLQRDAVAAVSRRHRQTRISPRVVEHLCRGEPPVRRGRLRAAAHGALVWVQDHQLQLVPKMLRMLRPDLRIGFFLHIPFPRSSCSCRTRGAPRSSKVCSAPT